MPNKKTFDISPIKDFISKYLKNSKISIDPFSGDNHLATYTNDLNPNKISDSHLDAEDFIIHLKENRIFADLVLFDPPYSPRQICECYKIIGLPVNQKHTQNSALYKRIRLALIPILSEEAVVLSFGWNSCGMGKNLGFEILEILLVCHGGAHNDTICLAERRISDGQYLESRVSEEKTETIRKIA